MVSISNACFKQNLNKSTFRRLDALKIAKQTLHYVTLHIIFGFHFPVFHFSVVALRVVFVSLFVFSFLFVCGMFMTVKYSFFNCFAPVNSENFHCYCHIFKSHMRKTSHSNGNQHDMHVCIIFSFFPSPTNHVMTLDQHGGKLTPQSDK